MCSTPGVVACMTVWLPGSTAQSTRHSATSGSRCAGCGPATGEWPTGGRSSEVCSAPVQYSGVGRVEGEGYVQLAAGGLRRANGRPTSTPVRSALRLCLCKCSRTGSCGHVGGEGARGNGGEGGFGMWEDRGGGARGKWWK
eukprot:12169-Chlamydomonas_euryale.AAC.2